MKSAGSAFIGAITAIAITFPGPGRTQSLGQAGFEQNSAILDTAVLFAIGAREADQAIRGAFGWPTFQEGFVEGVYFRFDPDGYARFSPSPRLDEDVYEIICLKGSTACIAKKGIIEVGLTQAGKIQIKLNGITPSDSFFVSDRKSELPLPQSILEPLTPRLEAILAGGGELIIKREVEVVQTVSLVGFSAVATYLRWVAQQQSPRVFPRGWPVPAQSAAAQHSGLTQPNQWSPANPGPQTSQTTWQIQQRQLASGGVTGNRAPLYTGSGGVSKGFQQVGATPLQDVNSLTSLQQQIQTLQNNLQQLQSSGGSPSGSYLQTGQPSNDLVDYGQAFAQQAQGRSLPESPGQLGVKGVVPRFGSQDSASDAGLQTRNSISQPPSWQQTAEQTTLARVQALELAVIDIRKEFSAQLIGLKEEIARSSALSTARPNINLDEFEPPSVPKVAPSEVLSSEELLSRLEKTLLARLSAQNQSVLPSPQAETASTSRQLLEDLLGELDAENDIKQPAVSPGDTVKVDGENDDFVTLNSYINQVLKKEGLQAEEPGR